MTRPVRRLDLVHVAQEGRHAGELLMHPCRCGHTGCTLGDHIWRSTRDMTPGVRSSNTDPRARTTDPAGPDPDAPADRTAALFATYQHHVTAYRDAARDLEQTIQALRPDRHTNTDHPGSDDIWCRSCLRLGRCEPRHRGELCRWCADFTYVYATEPPLDVLGAHHDGRRLTRQQIDAALVNARRTARRRRRKAS